MFQPWRLFLQGPAIAPDMWAYTANLCLFWSVGEFSNLREHFGQAVGDAIERAADSVVVQGTAEQLQDVLSIHKRVDHAVSARSRRSCRSEERRVGKEGRSRWA